MASLVLDRLAKTYPNGTCGLVDCSLAVADGELVVLVGPSGCGKSTLLRLVAGLEEPTGGTIRIDGAVVNERSPQARNVAMVFQDYALYPHLTVQGNLEFPLRMRRLARVEIARRTAWAAGLLGLERLLDRLPKQLSGGQRQRVAMGRALVREPTVFLLDEPLSNLDAKLRVQVRAEIGELQRRIRTTMVYVTHDQVEAMTLGDRVAVLHEGRLRQVAPPQDIYDHPASAFVAGFIGNPPMNLVPGRLACGASGGLAVTVADATLPLPPGVAARLDRAHPARDVTVGIRPEALRLTSDGAAPRTLRARVSHVEWLGHETLAYVRTAPAGGDTPLQLVARLPGMCGLAKDEDVALTVAPEELHLFGADGTALAR